MSNIQFQSITKFVEICDGLRKPINSAERNKRIAGKNESKLYPYYGATGQVGVIDDYLMDGEYVLVGEDGAPFLDTFKNKAYIVKGKGWVNNHAHILKAIEGRSSNEFICHYLNYFNYDNFVNGTTRLKLTKSKLTQIPVPNFTFENQIKITEKVNNLFKSIDIGFRNLKISQSKLDAYKKSIIDSAIRGKLVPQDSNDEPASVSLEKINFEKNILINSRKFKKEKLPSFDKSNEKNFDLSAGWIWSTVGDVCKKNRPISYGVIKLGEHTDNGVPILRSSNIRKLFIEIDNLKCIDKKIADNFQRTYLNGDEVLMTIRGTLGGVCVAKKEMKGWNISREVAMLSTADAILPDYLAIYLSSPFAEAWFKSKLKGIAYTGINLEDLRLMPVAVPPVNEQKKIINVVNASMHKLDGINSTIEIYLKNTLLLKNSILKSAFEGNLI